MLFLSFMIRLVRTWDPSIRSEVGVFFVDSNESFFYCHSERAFGRGRIPTAAAQVGGVKMYSVFNFDSSIEYAGSFTSFRMTNKSDLSIESAGFFTSFRMTCWVGFVDSNESFFYCHSERAFGRGRIPTAAAQVGGVKMYSVFNYDSSIESVGFFTAFRMTNKGDSSIENAGFFTAFRMTNKSDSSIENAGFFTAFRMTNKGDSFLESAGFFTAFRMTNKSDLSIESAGFFTAFRMTNKGDSSIENEGFFTAFRMTSKG